MRKIIGVCVRYGSHWPPGLCSIEKIAVGVESDTWMSERRSVDEDEEEAERDLSSDVFASLLRLPRMVSIYFNRLQRTEDYDYGQRIDGDGIGPSVLIPKNSPNVKNIFLDNGSEISV